MGLIEFIDFKNDFIRAHEDDFAFEEFSDKHFKAQMNKSYFFEFIYDVGLSEALAKYYSGPFQTKFVFREINPLQNKKINVRYHYKDKHALEFQCYLENNKLEFSIYKVYDDQTTELFDGELDSEQDGNDHEKYVRYMMKYMENLSEYRLSILF